MVVYFIKCIICFLRVKEFFMHEVSKVRKVMTGVAEKCPLFISGMLIIYLPYCISTLEPKERRNIVLVLVLPYCDKVGLAASSSHRVIDSCHGFDKLLGLPTGPASQRKKLRSSDLAIFKHLHQSHQ